MFWALMIAGICGHLVAGAFYIGAGAAFNEEKGDIGGVFVFISTALTIGSMSLIFAAATLP